MDAQGLTQQIEQYTALAADIYAIAGQLGTGFRQVLALVKPDHSLTDEQINAIEQAVIADAAKRQAEREAMAQPDATGQP